MTLPRPDRSELLIYRAVRGPAETAAAHAMLAQVKGAGLRRLLLHSNYLRSTEHATRYFERHAPELVPNLQLAPRVFRKPEVVACDEPEPEPEPEAGAEVGAGPEAHA